MKKFKKIYVEITNECNLSCDFCPGSGRNEKFMDSELFGRILEEVREFTVQLYFHVLGEPLMHPDLDVFLDMCHGYGFKVNITTNGTLIDRKAGVLLSKPALRQVNFSLHSFEANYRDYPIDIYLDRIFDFIERSKEREKLLIGLRLWNISDKGKNEFNRYILERIEKQFKLNYKKTSTSVHGSRENTDSAGEHRDPYRILVPSEFVRDEATPVVWNEATPVVRDEATPVVRDEATPVVRDEATLVVRDEATPVIRDEATPVNGIKLSENIFLHIAEVFDWPDIAIDNISSRGFCYGLRNQAAILVDGTVVPCCLDGQGVINLGNIREQSFTDIIQSERARNLYEGFSRRDAVEPLCRKCGYRRRFDEK